MDDLGHSRFALDGFDTGPREHVYEGDPEPAPLLQARATIVTGEPVSTNFERSRRRIAAGLLLAACLIVAYWVAWWADRDLVASRTTSSYYSFEDAFQIADAWLLITVVAAAVQLARQRASALLWLIAAGSAGLYLLGIDLFYDLAHGIYGSGGGGAIELAIDILVAGSSVVVLMWSWHYKTLLLK